MVLINKAFRDWTRGVSFTLTMGKTQVAQLVSIAESARVGHSVGMYHRLGRLFVAGLGGLNDRGLIKTINRDLLEKKLKRHAKKEEVHLITDAGKVVIELLKISGVYQEIAAEMHQSDREHGFVTLKRA